MENRKLQEQIEYALIEKGLVHQLGAEYITQELAPFIADKVSALNRKQSEAVEVAKDALLPLAKVSKAIKRTNGKEEDCGIWRGQKSEFEEVRLTVADARNAEKALEKIEEMQKSR